MPPFLLYTYPLRLDDAFLNKAEAYFLKPIMLVAVSDMKYNVFYKFISLRGFCDIWLILYKEKDVSE